MKQIDLTSEQMAAVRMVQDNQVSVLTGAAGTGKTTVIKEVLDWAAGENMISLLSFNVTDDQAGPTATTTVVGVTGEVYASLEGLYVVSSSKTWRSRTS